MIQDIFLLIVTFHPDELAGENESENKYYMVNKDYNNDLNLCNS